MVCRTRLIVSALTFVAIGLGAIALFAPQSAVAGGDSMKGDGMSKMDIIQVATGPGMQEVTTLVTAVKAAGLVETLRSPGPFTVFAPTNEAFNKLPPGALDSLLKPENKDKLTAVLTFHVVPGRFDAKQVMGMNSFKTAQGEELQIKEVAGKFMVGNDKGWATIIKTDVPASNGVIHWIDAVVMP